jgi:branched-subunit amino acid aminotransferase/4-amino-4-deoxychorismate lyase
MSEANPSPRSSVFTTMRFSQERGLFLFESHLERMLEHAAKLRIDESNINREEFLELLQKNPPQISEGLVRIECTKNSELSVTYRPFTIQNEAIDAITVPSPIWPPRVAGTKHGAWGAYIEARNYAEQKGADLALMVHDYSIVDGDRCTPLVLDEDGVVWVSHANSSVSSVTFNAMHDSILEAGFHIQQGNLNERLVARCVEAIAVGSGVGVLKIDSIDNEIIGDGGTRLFDVCVNILDNNYNNPSNWEEVWSHVA